MWQWRNQGPGLSACKRVNTSTAGQSGDAYLEAQDCAGFRARAEADGIATNRIDGIHRSTIGLNDAESVLKNLTLGAPSHSG